MNCFCLKNEIIFGTEAVDCKTCSANTTVVEYNLFCLLFQLKIYLKVCSKTGEYIEEGVTQWY